ncbi:hypothetical protein [Parasedimentitalea marina]|nr:hypothetical protein [Parasedimentitalea marina]
MTLQTGAREMAATEKAQINDGSSVMKATACADAATARTTTARTTMGHVT